MSEWHLNWLNLYSRVQLNHLFNWHLPNLRRHVYLTLSISKPSVRTLTFVYVLSWFLRRLDSFIIHFTYIWNLLKVYNSTYFGHVNTYSTQWKKKMVQEGAYTKGRPSLAFTKGCFPTSGSLNLTTISYAMFITYKFSFINYFIN